MIVDFYQDVPSLGIEGKYSTSEAVKNIGLPDNLSKRTFLDVGCNGGAFMLEAINRWCPWVTGVEPQLEWRIVAHGVLQSMGHTNYSLYNDISKLKKNKFDVVLLLSVLDDDGVDDPQWLLDTVVGMTKGLLIVEINDRLQEKQVVLPSTAKRFGKNKDNKSVWHIKK